VLYKPCAIKIPFIQDLNDQQLAAFRKELEIGSNIGIPNVCRVIGACTVPGHIKIVMELMDNNLETLLHSDGVQLSLYERMELAKQAALGMNWLHAMNPAVIHGDLKTANLLIKKTVNGYRVQIGDHGLSTIRPRELLLLQDSVKNVKGIPRLVAPEVMRGGPFNEQSDVYSFGLVLWELLTREQPFAEYKEYAPLGEAICEHNVRPLVPHNCPAVLRTLMEQCWLPNPAVRPNFSQINNELDIILAHAAIADEQGRRFWLENFCLQEQGVSWAVFVKAFYAFLKLELPDEEGAPHSTDVLSLRCLKTLLTDTPMDSWITVERFGQLLN
jgi:serine/threonine protein kinase